MNESSLAVPYDRERLPAQLREELLRFAYDDYEEEQQADGGLDLRAMWAALYRNRWLIFAIMALSLLGGIASVLLTPPTYRARASVQIDQQAAKVLGTEDESPVSSSAEADRFLQTNVDVLKSRGLSERVARELHLQNNAGFITAVGGKPLEPDATETERRTAVVEALQDNLTVTLPRNSRVVGISFDSRSPAVSAQVANAFSKNLIESNLQRRFDTSAYAREFLQNQLAQSKARLEQSERAMISYARSAGLIDASAGASTLGGETGPRSLTTSSLVQLNQSYSAARAARVQAQQRWTQAQATPLMSLPEVLSNPAVQELSQRRAELQASYAQERQRRKEDHPAVQQAAAAIAELESQLNTIAVSVRNSIRDQYQVALRQEQALAGNVGQLKGETLSEQDRSVRYNILRREADTNRQLYDGLLQRYKEISAEAGATNNNISIIDRAEAPTDPISPRPMLNMSLAGMGGLALALLLVFARERFDDAIRAPDEVDRKLALPLLGTIPLIKGREKPGDALLNPRSPVSEAHYALRTSLELSSDEGVPRTLLLTSSRQGEGKSTSAFAMARDFALAGKTVILIDADLRKPSLHKVMGLDNKIGLSNVLARQQTLANAIQRTPEKNLYFIASGPLPPNPAQLLGSGALRDLLLALSNSYDHVILDGPPVMGLADSPRLASIVQGTIFVVEANRAHRGSARAALKRLLATRANVIGALLTKFDAKKAGYGEDYGYYSYRYGDEGTTALLGDGTNAPPEAKA